jgi:Cu/Ag efflux protein CusF
MFVSIIRWLLLAAASMGLAAAPATRPVPAVFFPMESQCQQFETATTGVFHGVGEIVELRPDKSAVTLDHEDIIGLMPGMVMMFRVAPANLLAGLIVGEQVKFDIDAKGFVIVGIRPVAARM